MGQHQMSRPRVFIAGGAGITPFIVILRHAEHEGTIDGNRLFFSNTTREDVFLQADMVRMLGASAVLTLTQEKHDAFEHGRIDQHWLNSRVNDFDQPFYVCGPPAMVDDVKSALDEVGAETESVVFEN